MHRSARRAAARNEATSAVARRSEASLAFFGLVFERTLKRDFHALRLARVGKLPPLEGSRIVVYTNHPSWWDGVLYVVLARRLFPRFKAYAPIDAKMLIQYPMLARLGAYGVEQNSARGAADFIEAGKAIFKDANTVIFVAAQGRFADVRERPLRLSPGLTHLADIAAEVIFLPLAIEANFWNEKRPELLICFGRPTTASDIIGLPKERRLSLLEERLEHSMDELRDASMSRDHSKFDALVKGNSRINVVYDAWRRLSAFARGRQFRSGHGSGAS